MFLNILEMLFMNIVLLVLFIYWFYNYKYFVNLKIQIYFIKNVQDLVVSVP